jgi:hypothetical protein
MDLRDIGREDVDRNYVAQDTDQWRFPAKLLGIFWLDE